MKHQVLKITLFLVLVFCLPEVSAQESQQGTQNIFDKALPEKADKEFQFIALSYTQFVNNNLKVQTPFFQGQVLGRLFGGNTSTTFQGRSAYFEQRFLPFFIYRPKLMNGKVTLRASFEIDYTWGDASYGTAGNQGSAPGSDQVNLQTQNVMIEAIPFKGWFVNLGLQRMFDNHANPYRVLFDELMSTGYRLSYFGSDGVGINIRKEWDYSRFYAGYYQLYENNIDVEDDVYYAQIGYEKDITKTWKQAFTLWHLGDRSNGQGGSIGIGPGSSITDLNGTFRFNSIGSTRYDADLFWIGTTLNRNYGFSYDRTFLTGFVNYNIGNIRTKEKSKLISDISGIGANLRAGHKYGQTNDDAVFADLIYTSGDRNHNDKLYTGVMTGNNWGTPLSLFINHGSYLLFPHGNVVNRFVAAVNDPSNAGYGLRGGTLNFHKAFIPHKLVGKIGSAISWSDARPNNGGSLIGTEFNAMMRYTPKVYMDIELHMGYLFLGDFYNSPLVNGGAASRPVDPWTIFLAYRWLMF
jgi:hypothetical protein